MTELDRFRILVCVGTGGVGKTTIAAALAYQAARRGRRSLVLTIDPARALARALGLAALGEPVQIVPDVPFSAAMLDQKQAWDAFITRHAPSETVARSLLANPFYQRLSTSFAGSTEYMAVEEMCRQAESGRYDLIVLDTPPSAHALDFVSAPGRIDQLFDRRLAQWFAGGAWRTAGAAARYLFRKLEAATGAATLRDIAAFFVALDALVDATLERTRRVRALLRGGDAGFVLVAAPRQLAMEETGELFDKLAAQPTPLASVVINRVHSLPAVEGLAEQLASVGDDAAGRWLRAAWTDAAAEVEDERAVIDRFRATLPQGIRVRAVPEAAHDLHALADLAHVVEALSDPE